MQHLVALVGALALTPLVRRWLVHHDRMDRPSARSLHTEPTPRGGGLAPVAAFVAAVACSGGLHRDGWTMGAIVAAFAAIGLSDDLASTSAGLRLALQGAAAAIAVAALSLVPSEGVLVATLAALWLVAFVNACNFMDGANGLATGQAIVAGAAWWLIARHEHVGLVADGGAALGLAALGFLPYNFPRARVFLGDVGSYGLGAAMAILVVLGVRDGVAPVAMVAPVALFVADAAVTLLRRVVRRERILEAHRQHAFQRLVALGWGHVEVTIVVVVLSSASAGCGALALGGGWWTGAATVGVLAVVGLYLSLPAVLGRRQ